MTKLSRFQRAERGQTFVEYVMLLALLSLTVTLALIVIGPSVSAVYEAVGETVSGVADGSCVGGDDDPSDPDCD